MPTQAGTSTPSAAPASSGMTPQAMQAGYEKLVSLKSDPVDQANIGKPNPNGNGSVYLGQNRYGLPAASQERVANRALGEAKYGTNANVLNLILKNLNANGPGVFDRAKYPLLGQMLDAYTQNNNAYPVGSIDLSGYDYSPVAGTPDVRTWAQNNPSAYGDQVYNTGASQSAPTPSNVGSAIRSVGSQYSPWGDRYASSVRGNT